jgi:tRNA acetyltransferase TAN1
VPRDFNILATTERISESRACSELWMLLRAAGDESPIVDKVGIWGVVVAKTLLDPTEAIAKMRLEYLKKPEVIQALYRVIPIQRLVNSTMEEIVKTAQELSAIIGAEDSYRITVEKRRTNLSSNELVTAIADPIERRVDLDNPNWVILVEITGRVTGVSVIRPRVILNVQKERARLAMEAKKGAALHDKPS